MKLKDAVAGLLAGKSLKDLLDTLLEVREASLQEKMAFENLTYNPTDWKNWLHAFSIAKRRGRFIRADLVKPVSAIDLESWSLRVDDVRSFIVTNITRHRLAEERNLDIVGLRKGKKTGTYILGASSVSRANQPTFSAVKPPPGIKFTTEKERPKTASDTLDELRVRPDAIKLWAKLLDQVKQEGAEIAIDVADETTYVVMNVFKRLRKLRVRSDSGWTQQVYLKDLINWGIKSIRTQAISKPRKRPPILGTNDFRRYMERLPGQDMFKEVQFGTTDWRISIQAGQWARSVPKEKGLDPTEYTKFEVALRSLTDNRELVKVKRLLIDMPDKVSAYFASDGWAQYVPLTRVDTLFKWMIQTFGKPRVVK
jgi:hypothetical protein